LSNYKKSIIVWQPIQWGDELKRRQAARRAGAEMKTLCCSDDLGG
jgi:hypothetical protein